MTRGKNGFERKDDATFRLSRLMNIRNQVIELLGGDDVEHLYTIFGTRNVEEQNKYISQLIDTFMRQKNNHEGKKAGENGKTFGSVSSKEIAQELEKQGLTVDKKKIVLPEPIKEFGKYDVKIKLHKDVQANVKVNVVEG